MYIELFHICLWPKKFLLLDNQQFTSENIITKQHAMKCTLCVTI